MSVFIDGATISSLFYSQSGSFGNQEGFLFGRIISHVKDHISDSQINNSEVQTYVYVSSHLPWPIEDRVYSRGGVPIMEKLGVLLGDRRGEVIGWYSFRRSSSLRMSLKEKTLHRNLADKFCPQTQDDFLFCLCVSSVTSDMSTHSVDHSFSVINRASGQVKKLPILVTNLGDTSHTEYRTLANSSSMQTGSVRGIINQFQSQFVLGSSEDMQEVKRINNMSSVLNNSLVKLCSQVVESEEKTGNLEDEVSILKDQLRQRQEEREKQRQMLLNPAEPQPVTDGADTDGACIETASLYPKLPTSCPVSLLGKGEPSGEEETSGTPGGMGSVDGTKKQASSVDELLCVSEVTCSVSAPQCESERLVSQPDELIDFEGNSSPERSWQKEATLDTPDKQAGGVSGAGPAKSEGKKNSFNAQDIDNHTKTKASNPSDHFSFVENMVKSECKKPATVPVGESLSLTSRTTRSQAKTETNDKQTVREKSKGVATHIDSTTTSITAESVSLDGTGKPPSESSSSLPPNLKEKSSQHIKTVSSDVPVGDGLLPADDISLLSGKPTVAQSQSQSKGPGHSDKKESVDAAMATAKESRSRKRLDPSSFGLGANKAQMTTRSGRTVTGDADHGLHENGTASKETAEIQLSSSPVF